MLDSIGYSQPTRAVQTGRGLGAAHEWTFEIIVLSGSAAQVPTSWPFAEWMPLEERLSAAGHA